ncbi:MAG: hypothetical protein ABSA02_37430, partial [Trebonia sp.]
MIAAVEGLVAELRLVGIPVSASEYIDALSALRFVDLGDRAEVKTAIGAAVVKDAQHESAYSMVFDLYFAGRSLDRADGGAGDRDAGAKPGREGGPAGQGDVGGGGQGGGVLGSADDDALTGLLLRALEANDPALLRALAAAVVTRYAG